MPAANGEIRCPRPPLSSIRWPGNTRGRRDCRAACDVVPEPKLSRHLEKRASLRGRHVSLLLPALFTVERQVEHDLFLVGEQVVQAIDLGRGVRKAPASAHHTMEVVVMLRVERGQHRDDRVPRVGAPGHDAVAADLASEPIVQWAIGRHLFSVHRRRGRYRRGIEDAHVLRERRDHQIDVHRPRVSAPRRWRRIPSALRATRRNDRRRTARPGRVGQRATSRDRRRAPAGRASPAPRARRNPRVHSSE